MQCILQRKGARNYGELIRSVVEKLELRRMLRDAARILIKPNFVTAKSSREGITTSTNLIGQMVEIVNEISDAEVVVGESSLLDTEGVFRHLNVYDLAKSGCRVENFDKGQWVEAEPPFSLLFKRMLIPKVAHESDFIINMGKMKTHELTGVTLGVKNFFGLLSSSGRRYAHVQDIDKGIVDIYSYFEVNKTVISIIDALVALSGKSGPTVGDPVELDCLIAGTSTVLCDATAARMMGVIPDEIRHLRMAAELFHIDLAESPTDEEEFAGSTARFDVPLAVESARLKWANISQFLLTRLFYKYPVQKDSQLCISCGRCEMICPKGVVSINGCAFTYNHAECVHCLSCVEACNTGAISYKIRNRLLFLLLRSCWRAFKSAKRCLNL